MCLEGPYDLEGLRQDANMPVVAADEEVVRSGTKAAQIITLATSALSRLYWSKFQLTSKIEELFPSSGKWTSEMSKKLKTFH